MLGFAQPAERMTKNIASMPNIIKTKVANHIDWRTYGYVSPVVDQGMCGADWAFVSVGALEGAYGVQQGEFTQLSVQ